jgi:hypothetical protein
MLRLHCSKAANVASRPGFSSSSVLVAGRRASQRYASGAALSSLARSALCSSWGQASEPTRLPLQSTPQRARRCGELECLRLEREQRCRASDTARVARTAATRAATLDASRVDASRLALYERSQERTLVHTGSRERRWRTSARWEGCDHALQRAHASVTRVRLSREQRVAEMRAARKHSPSIRTLQPVLRKMLARTRDTFTGSSRIGHARSEASC